VEVPESGSESDIGKPDVSLGYYRVHSYRLKFEFLVSCAMKALLAAGLNEIPRLIDHSDAGIPPSWKAQFIEQTYPFREEAASASMLAPSLTIGHLPEP